MLDESIYTHLAHSPLGIGPCHFSLYPWYQTGVGKSLKKLVRVLIIGYDCLKSIQLLDLEVKDSYD